MNYGNMQTMNSAAFMNIQANYAGANNTNSNKDLVKMNQQKLFNDYVNVGISHRIASGLSGRISGLIPNENIRNGISAKEGEKSAKPEDKSDGAGDESKSFPVEDLMDANATKP